MSRELGAEMLGVYQVAFSIFLVLVVIVASGLPLTISKQTAKYQVSKNQSAQYGVVCSALVIGLGVSIIICIVFVVFQDFIANMFTDSRSMQILLCLLPAVVFSAVYSAFRGSLWGTKNYFFVSLSEFVEQVVRIVVFVLLINLILPEANKGIVAGASMTVGCFVSMALMLVVYFAMGRRLAKPKGYYKEVIASALPITGVRTATSLIQPVIAVLFPFMLVLAGYTSEQAMSLYGIAMGMALPLLFLPSTIVGAMSFTLIPDLSVSVAQKNNIAIGQKIRSNIFVATLISILFVPFYIGAGKEICVFLYDNALAGVYLCRSAIIMLPLGLSNITSSILNALNLEVRSFVHNIIGGGVLIACIVGLSWLMGVDALILGFGLCMTITTILNVVMIKRHVKMSLGMYKPLCLMGCFVVLSSLLCYFVCNVLCGALGLFGGICIAGVCALGSFVLLCWVFRLVDVVSIVCSVLPKKFKKSA